MDERGFYRETQETRSANLNCSYCRNVEKYELKWLVRRKVGSLPRGADERDRAKFAKSASYMVLLDDKVTCKLCRRAFDVSGIKTTAFLTD